MATISGIEDFYYPCQLEMFADFFRYYTPYVLIILLEINK